jgi:fumarylacetoacetate (FAA) hydrolase
MKLGTLKDGTRDGALVVVSRDLRLAQVADAIAPTLQAALDDWGYHAPLLRALSDTLNSQPSSQAFEVDFASFAAPLPRAYQWADGSAYVNHVELVRKARGAAMPKTFWTDPLMYQGGSDTFLGPRDDIAAESEDWGIDLEGEVAVIVDDVPMGIAPKKASEHIALVMLVNDVSLRNLIPKELEKGFGFFQSKPSTAFSPVAVTPDELGDAWDGGKVNLPLVVHINDSLFGRPDAGVDMTFEFPKLIAHGAKSRRLGAGTIIGSGTVSNKDRAAGPACLAELRMLETIEAGAAKTPFLRYGDRVRIEMLDAAGHSIFGAIDQQVVKYSPPR